MQQIERDCFSVAKRRSISGFTRSSIYIYDISSLRVKPKIASVLRTQPGGSEDRLWKTIFNNKLRQAEPDNYEIQQNELGVASSHL